MRPLAFVAIALFAASCSVEIPDGRFACTSSDDCPPDFRCNSSGLCSRGLPEDAGADATMDVILADAPRDVRGDAPAPDAGPSDAAADIIDSSADIFDSPPLVDAGPQPPCVVFPEVLVGMGGSEVSAIAVADDGRIFIAGSYVGATTIGGEERVSRGDTDWFIAAFNRNGTTRFVETGGGNRRDGLRALVLDEERGGLYAAGFMERVEGRTDSMALRMRIEGGVAFGQVIDDQGMGSRFTDIALVGGRVFLTQEVVTGAQGATPVRARVVEYTRDAAVTGVRNFDGEFLSSMVADGEAIYVAGSDGPVGSRTPVLRRIPDIDDAMTDRFIRFNDIDGGFNDIALSGSYLVLAGQRDGATIRTIGLRLNAADFSAPEFQVVRDGAWRVVTASSDPYWYGGRTPTGLTGSDPAMAFANSPTITYPTTNPAVGSEVRAIAASAACPDYLYLAGRYSGAVSSLSLPESSSPSGFLSTVRR